MMWLRVDSLGGSRGGRHGQGCSEKIVKPFSLREKGRDEGLSMKDLL